MSTSSKFLTLTCLLLNSLFCHDTHKLEHDDDWAEFLKFISKYKKVYKDEEELFKRFLIFKSSLKSIRLLQASDSGTAKYGWTEYSDLTKEEQEKHFGLIAPKRDLKIEKARKLRILVPPHMDWRDHSAVSPVQVQGECQSCYAFAVVGNIEGIVAVKYKKLFPLSIQHVVDCDIISLHCAGGYLHAALYFAKRVGVQLDSDYKYRAENHTCEENRSMSRIRTKGLVKLPYNEDEIAAFVFVKGPVAAGMNGNILNLYQSGVMNPLPRDCNSSNINHGVVIVGFGEMVTNNGLIKYWICKNSWGPRWGEGGYFRIIRGIGACAINQYVYSAVV